MDVDKKLYSATNEIDNVAGKFVTVTRYKGTDIKVVYPDTIVCDQIYGIGDCSGTIPDNAKKITSVVIPEGYNRIGARAFKNFVKLKTVVLPNSILDIGDEAFAGCKSLENIVIPYSCRNIGKYAFKDSGLRQITINSPDIEYGSAWLKIADVTIRMPENAENFKKFHAIDIDYTPDPMEQLYKELSNLFYTKNIGYSQHINANLISLDSDFSAIRRVYVGTEIPKNVVAEPNLDTVISYDGEWKVDGCAFVGKNQVYCRSVKAKCDKYLGAGNYKITNVVVLAPFDVYNGNKGLDFIFDVERL